MKSVSLLLMLLQMALWALRIAVSLLLGSEICSVSNQSSIICLMLRGWLCAASLMLLFKENSWITLPDVEYLKNNYKVGCRKSYYNSAKQYGLTASQSPSHALNKSMSDVQGKRGQ